MAAGQTRHEIPKSLRIAQRYAIDRFLLNRLTRAGRSGNRISAHPQHNVVGVGVGAKIKKNKPTARPSLRLYVVQKLDRKLIPKKYRLPDELKGVETDVVELGYLRAQVANERKRNRPARPGCSIGFALPPPQDDLLMAGTLGAMVTDGQVRYILSNNHILANENKLPLGAAIFQPGLLDHGNPGADAIAHLSRCSELSYTAPNRLDCAIAEIVSPESVGSAVMPKIGKIGRASCRERV